MAWEWSHTQEAMDIARDNLGKKSMIWLAECWAEWKCKEIDNARKEVEEVLFELAEDESGMLELPDVLTTDPYLDGRYVKFLNDAKCIIRHDGKEQIAEDIWMEAEQQATCENGGHNPWMCPEGCHTVEW